MDTKQKTLTHYLIAPLGLSLGFVVTAIILVFVLGHGEDAKSNTGVTVMDIRENAKHSSAAVLEKHPVDGVNCWTGEAPKDVAYPGHVIWQKPDGYTVYSAKLVDPALNTLFGNGKLAGHPIAFCR